MPKNTAAKTPPPKFRPKETKSCKRMFRFTEKNWRQLNSLAKRYGTNVSKIMDVLVAYSFEAEFEQALDSFVSKLIEE